MSASVDDFPSLLRGLVGTDPGRPLITAYDEETGERTELSVATYANWVAKVANLFVEEYLLEEGDTVRLDLPRHWLSTVLIGAAWSAGLAVTTDRAAPVHLVVAGPEPDPARGDVPTVACALTPFATRFPAGPPEDCDDFGLLWPAQPDVFVPAVPPSARTTAWRGEGDGADQGTLLARARAAAPVGPGGRLLTDLDPLSDRGTGCFLSVLVHDASLVLVRRPVDAEWPARHEDERATDVLRSDRA